MQKKKSEEEEYDDAERAAIADVPDDMKGLPKFGQVPKCSSNLKLQSDAQERGVKSIGKSEKRRVRKAVDALQMPALKSSAEDRTQNMFAAVNEAQKRGTEQDITEKLTDSVKIAKLDVAGETTTKEEDIEMATKKASKKSAKKNGAVRKTAEPIGRERKLLLRLSKDEYNALQAKAEKQGTSMANLLRTSAIG